MEAASSTLTPGMLAFIALAAEYCQAVQPGSDSTRRELVARLTRLLPRIYMSAADLPEVSADEFDDAFIEPVLDEEGYEAVRRNVEALMGGHDVYLETFEADMKYSDTPIGASVAEGVADLYQVLFNFTETVREAMVDRIPGVLAVVKEDFKEYWSQTVCNLMRPLNHLRYDADGEEDDDVIPEGM